MSADRSLLQNKKRSPCGIHNIVAHARPEGLIENSETDLAGEVIQYSTTIISHMIYQTK